MSAAAAAALAAAEQQLALGRPAACLAVLAALAPDQREALPARRLQALCHIQLAGDAARAASSGSSWWKVFGLEAQHASAADVRRQFRRLSALVHPDKCRLEGAHEAFQRLQAAAEALQRAVEEGGAAERPGKRARTAGEASGSRGAGSEWEAGGEEEEEDSWVPDGGGFPWWSEWDVPAQQGQQAAGGAVQHTKQKQGVGQAAEQQQQQRQQVGAGDGAAQTEEQQDEEQLLAMGLDALRAEVRQRQAGLLQPQLDAQGRRIPLPQLQAALRRARTVLADRVAADAEQRAAASGGGFLRSS